MLVDERPIQSEHLKLILKSPELNLHLQYINGVLDFLDQYSRAKEHSNDSELIYLRLIIRSFNSLAASLRLALMGYWQPCFSQARDLFETYSLLDLFNSEPSLIQDWLTTDEKKGGVNLDLKWLGKDWTREMAINCRSEKRRMGY